MPFWHDISQHKQRFESVCVAVQYDIENGHPLFHRKLRSSIKGWTSKLTLSGDPTMLVPASRLVQMVGPSAQPLYTVCRWVRLPRFHPKTKRCQVQLMMSGSFHRSRYSYCHSGHFYLARDHADREHQCRKAEENACQRW
jgi:hypothetical protein